MESSIAGQTEWEALERDSHMHLASLQANNTLSIHCMTRAFSEGLTLAVTQLINLVGFNGVIIEGGTHGNPAVFPPPKYIIVEVNFFYFYMLFYFNFIIFNF